MDDSVNVMPLVLGGVAGVFSASGLWAYSVFAPRCQFWAPVIRSLPQREAVALTFNDGPHPQYTPRVLEILARHGVKAAFFVIGRNAQAHPDLIRQIHAAGHDIGNHSWDHAPFRLRDEVYWQKQIRRTQEAVGEITGSPPLLFRPPAGYKTRALARAAKEARLPIIGWSVRAKAAPADSVAQRLIRSTTGHDIVVMHDGTPPHLQISRQYTLEALSAYLEAIVDKKLQFVPLVTTLVAASADLRAGAEKAKRRAVES